jgi:hypothetical protein
MLAYHTIIYLWPGNVYVSIVSLLVHAANILHRDIAVAAAQVVSAKSLLIQVAKYGSLYPGDWFFFLLYFANLESLFDNDDIFFSQIPSEMFSDGFLGISDISYSILLFTPPKYRCLI